MKTCCTCKKELSLDCFYKRNESGRQSYRSQCKFCMKNNRKEQKKGYSKYLTDEEYNSILELQEHVCAICKKKEIIIHKRTGTLHLLSVDHNHVTGKVRGLLCRKCNSGLGHFNDDLGVLIKATEYLRKYA